MKGNRPKINNETLPDVEVKHHKNVVEVRYDFEEIPAHTINIGDEQEDVPASFNYKYVKLPSMTKKHLKVAVIRTEYPTYDDEIAAINENEYAYFNLRDKVNDIWDAYLSKYLNTEPTEDEIQERLNVLDRKFDAQATKRLLQKFMNPILDDEANIDQQTIEDSKMLYNQWKPNGKAYTVDEKVVHQGKLYKVLQSHVSQSDWTPDVSSSLFSEVRPPDTITVWEDPTAENPYMTGDKVYFPNEGDTVYESTIDDNVWSPSAYPAGWDEVTQ